MRFLILFLFLINYAASAQETIPKVDSDAKTPILVYRCDEGYIQCEKLESNRERYNQCMNLVCQDQPDKIRVEDTRINADQMYEGYNPTDKKTCSIGLIRCDQLRTEPSYYWECMRDTCTNSSFKDADVKCEEGLKECTPKLNQYYSCNGLVCRDRSNRYKECPKGVQQCGGLLKSFWYCMSDICIGDIYQYRDPSRYVDPVDEDYVYMLDENGEKVKVLREAAPQPILGVPLEYRYPPEGVSENQWLHLHIPKASIKAPVTQTHVCPDRSERMICADNSALNCVCTGGSTPRLRNRGDNDVRMDGR